MKTLLQNLHKPSYRRKLFLYCLLLSLTPVVILGLVSSHIATKSIQEEVNLRHETVLNQIEYEMNLFLQSITKTSMLISSNPTISATFDVGPSMKHLDLSLDMIKQLSDYKANADVTFDISLMYNRFGTVYSNRYGLIPVEEFPYTAILDKIQLNFDSFGVVPPGNYANQNEMLLVRGMPLTGAPFTGYVIMHVDTKQLTGFLQQLNVGSSKRTVIIDENGYVVISSEPKEIGTRFAGFGSVEEQLRSGIYQGEMILDNEQSKLSAVKSEFGGWTYITFTPVSDLTERSEQIQRLTWTIVIVLLLFWLVVVLLASNRMYFPIQRLLSNVPRDRLKATNDSDGLHVLDDFMYQMVKSNQELQHEIKNQTPYIMENMYQKLLLGEIKRRELKSNTLFQALKGPWFCVCVVDMDQYSRLAQSYTSSDLSDYFYILRKILEELCEEYGVSAKVIPLHRQVGMIVDGGKHPEETDPLLRETLEGYRAKVSEYLRFTVTVTVSQWRMGISETHESYQEAVGLLNYRLFLGRDTTIFSEEIKPSLQESGLNLVKLQKEIAGAVAQGDEPSARTKLSQMIELVPKVATDSETVYGLFIYIIGEVSSRVQELGGDPQQVVDERIYRELYDYTTLQDLEAWFNQTVFPEIMERLRQVEVSERKQVVHQVVRYIEEHLHEGLSLKEIADELGLSQPQLSRMFKEEMDLSYSEYLMHYRMEKAKEWLEGTDLPVKEIAERLSYASVQNFTRSFKQVIGVPPAQYRVEAREASNRTDSIAE